MAATIVRDAYALSPIQQGMLFHYLYGEAPGVDVEQLVLTLPESVEAAALERAWAATIDRHPALRTRFRWEDLPEPRQEVLAGASIAFQTRDLRDLPVPEREDRFLVYLDTDRERGFDLAAAPPLRLALFRFGEADYRLVWTFHHALLDGRSFAPILEEVFACYEAFRRQESFPLEPARPYRDYIDWLGRQDVGRSEPFWRAYLQGFCAPTAVAVAPPSIPLAPGDEPYGRHSLLLSAAALTALRAAAQEAAVTLNTLVQAAWGILLSRYTGEEAAVFGATRACRNGTVPAAESIAGCFINTLPVRVRGSAGRPLMDLLRELRQQHLSLREHEQTPLVDIQRWSELPGGTSLFECILVFENFRLQEALRSRGGTWERREVRLLERTGYPLTLNVSADHDLLVEVAYDRSRFDDQAVCRLLGHFTTLLQAIPAHLDASVGDLPMLTETELGELAAWNATDLDYPSHLCVHQLFEAQARRTPDALALIFQEDALTYAELNRRANRLAHRLRQLGVGPETLVGLCVERSVEMLVGLLGILKAGGAYLPLDPHYPAERLAFMLEDAQVPVLLTQERLTGRLRRPEGHPHQATLLCLDADADAFADQPEADPESRVAPEHLAYVIYTSGSTGKPKGVMVEHRSVVNFFAGMDQRIDAPAARISPTSPTSPTSPKDPDPNPQSAIRNPKSPGVWLAVTSLSFDISVLELFWTLARGFTVVLHGDAVREVAPRRRASDRRLEFSLFYFASEEGERGPDAYRLLLEGAKFADRNGFTAVWTPERHFHAFGGLYPNPAVTSAALAALTERIAIRAGSCVLPLHSPIRVAEEWALVDNLSRGRVGISFASGWQPNDFAIAPQNFADRRERMFRDIETVRRLWRGESVPFPGPKGDDVPVRTLPRPVQPELPVWVTAAGSPDTFRSAGEIGAGLLTHLLGQSVEELGQKLAVYRQAWRDAGHAGEGQVTLMLHTFVGDDVDSIRETVREPMKNYLRSSVDLIKKAAWSFPALKQMGEVAGKSPAEIFDSGALDEAEMDALLNHAFERYFDNSALFGTPEGCLALVEQLKTAGVDEIACLIDFGVEPELALAHLDHLNRLRQLSIPAPAGEEDYSIPRLIERHGVTHLQCTPSLASLLLLDERAPVALGGLRSLLIGGEAFPVGLAQQLRQLVPGQLLNMYGPTETTIWSSTWSVDGGGTVPIGRPIANTSLYVMDRGIRPLPVGIPGELLIGGDGVVRGYLDHSELTGERFVRDPSNPTGRLYRTGDLARYRPDGNLEFLGRLDHQVKVRGHRIELGEIETALGEHASVAEAVVIAREDVPGDQRLVAYVIADWPDRQDPNPQSAIGVPASAGHPQLAGELRAHLAGRLPDFMLPSHYVLLERFPLTPNGKVDRRALPAPDGQRPEPGVGFVPPATAVEEELAAIWSGALGVAAIGRHDEFLLLGGHSLSAVQVAFRIRQAFRIDFPLQAFFQHRSLSEQSGAIETLLLAQTEEANLTELLDELDRLSVDEARSLIDREYAETNGAAAASRSPARRGN